MCDGHKNNIEIKENEVITHCVMTPKDTIEMSK